METIGSPLLWLVFGVVVAAALLVDLVLMRHGGPHKVTFKEAAWWSVGWVALAMAFNLWLWWYAGQQFGPEAGNRIGMEFLTGYLVEKSLAVDNIFVFLMVFNYFAVPAELRPLVVSFNGMLARLDDAFVRLSNFSADIAHELRTPLTQLMTHTEVVLARARRPEEYQEALYGNLEDLTRMARMIDDMLFLAKADNGLIVPGRAPLALHELSEQLLEYYRLLADERGIALERHGEGCIDGDAGMLRRALSNLLSNALRYTPDGGCIRVRIGVRDGEVVWSVENPGPAIPAAQRERLFDRFYRGDPARREGGNHAGLGLAITRSIVEAHGGRIACEAADGLTRFRMAFPLARRVPG